MLGGAVATPQFDSHFYGVPWILDTKYLFSNAAHLAKAKVDAGELDTWDGVLKAARAIKAAGVTKHPLVWSWQQAEALICDYAQLLGAFGGTFLDSAGKPAFQHGGGVQALEFMRQSIVDGLSNPTSTQSLEEDVRRVFSAGQASMALNWTYMYGMANDPKQSQVGGQVKVLQTPAGPSGRPGVNGSMALAVSAQSKNQDAAWKYITYLTSQPVQEKYALSSLPVWKSSYDNPAVVKTNPAVVPQAKKQLADLILRPQVKSYNPISQALQTEIQKALLGQEEPAAGAERRRGPGRDPAGLMSVASAGTATRAKRRAPRWSGVKGEARFALALLLPAAVVVFGVVLYPVARTFVISLFDVTSPLPGDYPFVGLSNYTRAFHDPAFYGVLGHTMYFTLVSTAARAGARHRRRPAAQRTAAGALAVAQASWSCRGRCPRSSTARCGAGSTTGSTAP